MLTKLASSSKKKGPNQLPEPEVSIRIGEPGYPQQKKSHSLKRDDKPTGAAFKKNNLSVTMEPNGPAVHSHQPSTVADQKYPTF
jgi:hypothetical protein